jgi:hypothetical protein
MAEAASKQVLDDTLFTGRVSSLVIAVRLPKASAGSNRVGSPAGHRRASLVIAHFLAFHCNARAQNRLK